MGVRLDVFGDVSMALSASLIAPHARPDLASDVAPVHRVAPLARKLRVFETG
jgi:hypothetical protein